MNKKIEILFIHLQTIIASNLRSNKLQNSTKWETKRQERHSKKNIMPK